jgi:HEPN domain-containing protein
MSRASYTIPARVRRGALKIVEVWGVRPRYLVDDLGTRIGFHTLQELLDAASERLGPDAGRECARRLSALWTAENPGRLPNTPTLSRARVPTAPPLPLEAEAGTLSEAVLLSVPDQWFAIALERGCEFASGNAFDLHRSQEAQTHVHNGITTLFIENGVPYEFGENGHLVPVGSATTSEFAIQPALDVLEDERFADARSHLIEAQKRLRESDPDEAVDEARMAVEHGMLAVIDATGTPRPARRQANELFDALANRDNAQPVFANRHAEELILAVPRFRGRTSAGHAGGPAIELGEAEAVVAGAAASLLFLATKLP